MDRLDAIKSFIEVANCRSFTQAAETLSLSRLQVTRHVQEVESWLQQRLLHRTTRKVSLTHAGEQAFIRCQRILDEAAALELDAVQSRDSLTGSIRISAPIGFSQHHLIDAVSAFTGLHPLVTVDILASDRFSQLVDERVDVALRYTDQPDETLIARKLMDIDAVVCATQGYLDEHEPIVEPEDLANHNCLVHLSTHLWRFVADNQISEVSVKGNIRANDLSTLLGAALAGKGVIRLPCDLANPLLQRGNLVSLLNRYTLPSSSLWAVYLSRSYQTPVVRQFIDFIAQRWDQNVQLWQRPA
ncbi:LysR family transcriptional regulator [Vibrio vulnificus]|uniref:LysR family transcriptional regulator n=1 Tax=Vibrio vulnificus TaxID=672 RepID=UPI000506F4A2|nr:LysR family transcriptional regulator [Vibrio vulnificus]EID4417948.1 LysR family transcriptional regulator [Vibrio vulnificus]ELV8613105.1 LysR family transcriptional regulator [Vibrio vulnificus]KFK54598.1 LysR family transcriptional regulator [Vibrio vulnificus]MCA3951418.1 LysR family transcriptional regulator [Vibrio vulnificus]MCG9655431.1 LysR family transcriptional regulator [Vibrio vulnificus]